MLDGRLLPWVRATWLGWTLGVLLTILAALAGEAIGAGESQTPVGLGMGTGVGIMQARAIRGLVSSRAAWIASSGAGLAAPFLAFDLARAAGLPLTFSLYVAVALGGLATGIWQAMLLRVRLGGRALAWIPGSLVGWSLAAGCAAIADGLPRALSLRGLAGAGLYLAVTLTGGLVLGLVTGLFLVRLGRRVPAHPGSGQA
jgi:hypothetical protein